MLQTAALVALPLIVLSAAAFFLFRNRQHEEAGHHGGPNPSRNWSFSQPENHGSESLHRRRPGSRARSENRDNECVICFGDRQSLVELYPCQHRNMCEMCVVELISRNHRNCPVCRRRFSGFV